MCGGGKGGKDKGTYRPRTVIVSLIFNSTNTYNGMMPAKFINLELLLASK